MRRLSEGGEGDDRSVVDGSLDAELPSEPRDGAAQRVQLGWTPAFDIQQQAGFRIRVQRIEALHRVVDDLLGIRIAEGDAQCAADRNDLADGALEDLTPEGGRPDGARGLAGEPADRGEWRDEREFAPQLGLNVAGYGHLDTRMAKGGRERIQAIGRLAAELAEGNARERARSFDHTGCGAGGDNVR